jgi:hypothetical protein
VQRSIVTARLGTITVDMLDHGGRWSAALHDAHPSLGTIDHAIGATCDAAFRTLLEAIAAHLPEPGAETG